MVGSKDSLVIYAYPCNLAAKLALYSAMRAQHVTKVELASRFGISESAVRKLANPDHRSHISQVRKALRADGEPVMEGATTYAELAVGAPDVRSTTDRLCRAAMGKIEALSQGWKRAGDPDHLRLESARKGAIVRSFGP